jgi:glycosyltransferase involved in cell wall biosynthesis
MLSNFYIDGYSYQENLIPKYHKLMGHDVEIIASLFTFDEKGKGTWLSEPSEYMNENNIKVTRLGYKSPKKIYRKMRRYVGFERALEKSKPDFLFIHGCSFMDIDKVREYIKKHPNVRVVIDNHTDFENSATNWLSKHILHGVFWKHCAQIMVPYVMKFYGVLPARVDFLKKMYKVPSSKCELLVMGADDIAVQAVTEKDKESIRKKYRISEKDILLLTSGKIDHNKKETLYLMRAVSELNYSHVRLLVMGSVIPELQEDFNSLIDGIKVIYGGWMNPTDTYKYFMAADLVVFPGLHSVYWEQAVGSGCACLFRRIHGFNHVDIGGNCDFFESVDVEGIKNKLITLLNHPDKIVSMRKIAQEKGKEVFSYSEIAKKSIGFE